jgi:hypothetical protein
MEDSEVSQVMGPLFKYVDKFTGKDYMLWKFKMETMLKARKLWGLVDGEDVKPSEGEVAVLFAYTKRES